METGSNIHRRVRKRAVRLTLTGQEVLHAAAQRRWQQECRERKFTRELRAELLGVSLATADRVWRADPVDRSTLVTCFANLGVECDDSFFSSDHLLPVSDAPQPDPPAQAVETHAEKRSNARWTILALAFAGVAVAILAARISSKVLPNQDPVLAATDWRAEFYRKLDVASRNYHSGRFDQAEVQFKELNALARAKVSSEDLACVARMQGDLEEARGNFQAARKFFVDSMNVREFIRQEQCVIPLLEALGDLDTKLGNYAMAERELNQSLAGYGSEGLPVGVSMVQRDLGTLAYERQDFAVAEEWFTKSLATISGEAKPDIKMDVRARRALVRAKMGAPRQAVAELRLCLGYWQGKQHPRWIAVTQSQLAQAERATGNESKARELFLSSRKGFESVRDTAGLVLVNRMIAQRRK